MSLAIFLVARGSGFRKQGKYFGLNYGPSEGPGTSDLKMTGAGNDDEPGSIAGTFGRRKRRVDEALALVDGAFLVQRIGQLSEDVSQDLPLTPLLKAPMNGFVVRITLGQQVPLRAVFRIQRTASKTARVGTGLRPERLSGMCSSGKCSRRRSH